MLLQPIRKAAYQPADIRHKQPGLLTGFMLALLLWPLTSLSAELPELSAEDYSWLGDQIFNNECNSQASCLVSWNQGEKFPSLGIGHFIWYQQGQTDPFEETFPLLIAWLHRLEVLPPALILDSGYDSPWQNREQFLQSVDDPEVAELRDFLLESKDWQTAFIIDRFNSKLPLLLDAASPEDRPLLETRLNNLATFNPPRGLYALIDYVHFKGTGLKQSERYKDQGWGLLQVLQNMDDTEQSITAFVDSARRILENRVRNAPSDRNEAQWLNGWFNRLDTYLADPSAL